MKYFKLKGIQPPGRVDLKGHGEVALANISDELAEKLWKEGLPYLELTDAGRKKFYPDEKPIQVKKVTPGKTTAKKKTEKK